MFYLRSDLTDSEIHQLLLEYLPPDVCSRLPGAYDFSCFISSCSFKWPDFMVSLLVYPHHAFLNLMELVWPEDISDEPFYRGRFLTEVPLPYLVDHGYVKEAV